MRARQHVGLLRVLDSLNLGSALRGSWLYGDFHLSVCGRYSVSDLDLVVHGAGANECADIAGEVHSRLGQFIDIPVSVHPADYIELMSLTDARVLVVGECLANLVHRVPTGTVTADYVRAKSSLMILRASTTERYASVARRVGSGDARLALFVKLGIAETFSLEACGRLLSVYSEWPVVESLRKCMCGPLGPGSMNEALDLLDGVTTVNPWLRNNLLSKMTGGSLG